MHPYPGTGSYVTGDSDGFWFFDPSNVELIVKILAGCALNGHYWVFGSASTDVGYRFTIRDGLSGASKTYVNLLGTAAPATTDTLAFATCS
ncbi:MAG TPA: hypothetical protein VNB06_05795 [Thermoanaerobaculia bacterium]|nr:hypothetical protein [Thermoanaerobaculia bacterium]